MVYSRPYLIEATLWLPGIKSLLKAARRKLQLTPMKQVLRELKERGINLKDLRALEVFGGSGEGHIKDYAFQVSTLDIWEIYVKWEKLLRRNFPMAQVKITNSYEGIRIHKTKYNFIVVDNGPSVYGKGYCEHFQLLPDIFRLAMDSCILVLNVIPEVNDIDLTDRDIKEIPNLFNESQLTHRQIFYKTNHPEKISFAEMVEVYKNLIVTNGFNLEWYFFQKRNYVYYLVLKINKSGA